MKITKYIITFGIISMFFSSCMMGPDFQKPDIEVADSYLGEHMEADTLNLRWWELFGNEVLDTMVVHALVYNRDVQMAAKRIEQARAYHGMTKADMWPSLTIQAGAGRGNYIGGGTKMADANNSFYVTPALSWELDFWGKYRSLSAAALSEMIASEFGMRSMQISLISEVSGAYFELLDYQNRLEISRKTVEARLKSLKIIQLRFDNGIIPEIDLNQAEAQWAIAAAAVPSYERAVAQTSYILSILLGENPQSFELVDNNYLISNPVIPAGIPSDLIERRPDISQAEAQLRAQNAQIGAAIAARFPSFSITGIVGGASTDLASFTTGGLAWSAGASLLGPIFEFGKNKRRVEVERKKAEELVLNYENTILYAFKDVEDALIRVQTLKIELEARKIYFNAIDNAAKLSALRYDKGVASYLEVLDSERSAFNAELELSEIEQNLLNSYVGLYKALGGGWLSSEEEEQAQQEQETQPQK